MYKEIFEINDDYLIKTLYDSDNILKNFSDKLLELKNDSLKYKNSNIELK